MRQRRWTGQTEAFTPNLTPLLDIVLQLITFFMILVHFGTKIEGASELIKLPAIAAALPSRDLAIDRLIVAVNAEGKLMQGPTTFSAEQMERWWADQAKLRARGLNATGSDAKSFKTIVIVRADKNASYGAVRSVLSAAQKQGFVHFSLIVLRSDAS